MPNARQLLEQADALMRRNRKRGKGKGGGPPTLTDALGVDRTSGLAPTVILPEGPQRGADPIDLGALPGAGARNAPPAESIALDTLSDLPVLTDVVDTWPPLAAQEWPAAAAEANADALSDALEADALAAAPETSQAPHAPLAEPTEAGVVAPAEAAAAVSSEATPVAAADLARVTARPAEAGSAPATAGTPPASEPMQTFAAPASNPPLLLQDEEFILDIPPASEVETAADAMAAAPGVPAVAPVPVLVPGSPAWEAMAEEIRMQVLQRLDLFTDTGMRDQLGARLQPIVARASAELVETINQALGELVRGYVAEAIEREIESWRQRGS